MRVVVAVLLALLTAAVEAATAYVTDELVLGVYAESSTQGQRLTTLHSGASVDTLSISGDATQVRLADGTIGWVKTAYLTNREPAIVRAKQLQAALDRDRSVVPPPAEAPNGDEVDRLMRELKLRQTELDEARALIANSGAPRVHETTVVASQRPERPWLWMAALCVALGCGFWLGHAVLARRVRDKFGGIKVY